MLQTWWALVLSHPSAIQLLGIVGRTALIYLAILLGMRMLGTRPLGRLSAYDFILVVVISNSVQNALVGGDNTLFGGLASAAVLLLMNQLFTWITERFPKIGKHLVGEPVVLINEGRAKWETMDKEGVTRDELMAALREHGIDKIAKAKRAILETDGSISVISAASHSSSGHPRFKGPQKKG